MILKKIYVVWDIKKKYIWVVYVNLVAHKSNRGKLFSWVMRVYSNLPSRASSLL